MEVASAQLAQETKISAKPLGRGLSFFPRWSLRARVIALITLLVASIVGVYTFVNIANLTNFLIYRTTDQAERLSNQIAYAVKQDLVLTDDDPFTTLATKSNSSTRELMESTIAYTRTILYVYISDEEGRIAADKDGQKPLVANLSAIGDASVTHPNLEQLAQGSVYAQLVRIFDGSPSFEFQKTIFEDSTRKGTLHIGVSAAEIRRELTSSIRKNVVIGLLAIIVGAFVAGISANLLLRPLAFISSRIERLEQAGDADEDFDSQFSSDVAVTGVTARLKQLGARLAGERSELEIMRGRLRQVVGHLEDRLLLINREGRVILASPDAEQVLGLKNIELTGLPIDESLGINHPLVYLIESAFNERRSIPRMTIRAADDVTNRQLLASVQYIEDAGAAVGALVSLRDYDSFQKFESQWDISKKLADLGRITSGIAHEVKNPLNSMVIHLEILRSKIESGSADPSPQIEILDSEIRRLDRVVQTFLNFTRPVEVHLLPLDLNSVVNQVVALASMEAAERGVIINRELVEGQLMVKGDPDLLKQTLLNVILNGCQAMPEGGPLRVATVRDKDELVKILIQDRGIGIPLDARDRIFNLYYTTKKGGTGIGLAQAFRAMQLHNGSIRFDSEVGIGTTFEIIMPSLS